jgi:hypothetical protein
MTELPNRLLRSALHDAASTTPSPVCADAHALAAWADGTMSAAARAAFEVHAADCARCQALIAAMVRIEPPPIQPAWWRRQPFAWLVPLATAAAAAVVVVDLTMTERRSSPPESVVRSEPASANRLAPPPTPSPAPPASVTNAANAHPLPSESPAPAPAAAPRPTARPEIGMTRPETLADRRAKSETRAGVPAPPGSPRSNAEQPAKDAVVAARAPATMPPPPAPTMPPPPAPAMPSPSAPAASPVFRDEARPDGARAAAQPMMKAVAAPVVIASPDRESQWRIVGSAVEHTADGGSTWQPQSVGVATPVRAGAAPAALVCWLAGVGGVVLRTTDGATWTRIAFPEPADLVAILASDASHATVTTATGRRFSTSDGGKTWTRE